MTTDTAVRVTRLVTLEKSEPNPFPILPPFSKSALFSWLTQPHLVPLDKVPYVDYPELRIDEHETTEMPFRYVKDGDGRPIMPDVSLKLLTCIRIGPFICVLMTSTN